ncbi:MAG: PilW family protein [Thermodesulfovibrionales bacterium]|nr:PilW family protein [Nitrospinota bacterium]MDP3048276.1 PilW family protein [Thermodesulfovibrionales bacterium]
MSKKESIQQTVDSMKESRQHVVDSTQGGKSSSLSTVYRLLSTEKGLLSTKAGFSLVELMITMVVFLIIIAAASGILTGMVTQFKQQSKIAETNIEGIIGLEVMRQDIEHAGYGLPWVIPATVSYSEASAGYNDSPSNPPRAILSGNGAGFNGSDELIIKATNIARNTTAQKWTYLYFGNTKKTWTPDCENVNKDSNCNTKNTVRVIVVSPGTTDANRKSLIVNSGSFFTQYGATSGFEPTDPTETQPRIIYGIDPDTDLRMPFNRADYYISTSSVPQRCASNTGVFSKNVISHSNGSRADNLPLLDCVADMQVVFGIDTTATPDGAVDCYVNNLSNAFVVNAENIRNRVREVRFYILAHEGQYDRDFTYTTNPVRVGEDLPRCSPGASDEAVLGRSRDLSNPNITNWQNYRWKVYTMVVKPSNLR